LCVAYWLEILSSVHVIGWACDQRSCTYSRGVIQICNFRAYLLCFGKAS
jgi:hypothetical protein